MLQVADAPRWSLGAEVERYLLLFSDGVHSQLGVLTASSSHLVRDSDLRHGTVIHVLNYIFSAATTISTHLLSTLHTLFVDTHVFVVVQV